MTTEPEPLTRGVPPIPPSQEMSEPVTAGPVLALDDVQNLLHPSAPQKHEACAVPDHEVRVNPIGGLVKTAVTARSLDEVIHLIRMLEESPGGEEAAGEALRAAAVERPVPDVAELIARLSEPPQLLARADEVIRAAAARRSIDDISRLVALLHCPPHSPQTGREAVHAAATELAVDELAELISRLESERLPEAITASDASPVSAKDPDEGLGEGLGEGSPTREVHAGGVPAGEAPGAGGLPGAGDVPTAETSPSHPERAFEPARSRPPSPELVRPKPPSRSLGSLLTRAGEKGTPGRTSLPPWLRWTTAAALLLCGATHFPLHRADMSTSAYAVLASVAGLCLLLAGTTLLSRGLPVLVADVVFLGALTAAHLLATKTSAATLASAAETGGAFAALTAILATLIALLALAVALTPGRAPHVS